MARRDAGDADDMTCVIPAWQIMEVLDMPKLTDRRAVADAAAEKEYADRFSKKPKAEVAAPPATDENPNG
jgi:hypothetical protein